MTMRNSRSLAVGAVAGLALAACVPPAPEPTPAPSPSPTPVLPEPHPATPVLQEIPTPVYENWMDAPATPGDWFYVSEPAESLALFGTSAADPVLLLRCDRTTRQVGIARVGEAPGPVPMRILTETAEREVTATPYESGMNLLITQLAANDRLLDAIAFSKGRFALETGGQETLYVPAWPEITRVIEDCRG